MKKPTEKSTAYEHVAWWQDQYRQAVDAGNHELASFRAGMVSRWAWELKEVSDNLSTEHRRIATKAAPDDGKATDSGRF